MSTPRNGVDITGIGPSYGSGGEDLPQQPDTPKQLGNGSTTTLDTTTWKIGEQGETYDGVQFYVFTRIAKEDVSSGVIKNHFIGFKLTFNGAGQLTEAAAEKELYLEQENGSGSGGIGLW
jgi:hypothetical protein